ncbi:CYFA0S14e01530g1_1 [Cyberlindnera fabianii]|uniref:Riboflavin synthase n=1 Tax=Cyberlindnera fabianii TaxID=36022 RepID=A0A061B2V3_CYBFA|nr:Riboflavin synthase [Cyberlindnera fabianii]CDR44271.1 CYFA0S14e01530g1_1 [Cyberlindnera fabianii]
MFTGIVEHIGTVKSFVHEADGNYTLTLVDASPVLPDAHIGDSIAINGVCLTVVTFTDDSFTVGLIPETLRRSNLGELKTGDKVNLERAVGGDVRFGGHYVQGHVDTVCSIVKREKDENAIDFTFELRDKQNIEYIVEKGFICLDGTSLTVTFVDYDKAQFGISMIKHTQENVVMPLKEIGSTVNVEVDVMGKLISKQVELYMEKKVKSKLEEMIEGIVEKKLASK